MRCLAGLAAVAALLLAAPVKAEVQVQFVDPRGFTDAGLDTPRTVDADAPALVALRRVLERAGQRLPQGHRLVIEVLDVDLAGYFPPWQRSGLPVRVMESTTWPRIRLRTTLTRPDGSVTHGEEVVSDMTYLSRAGTLRSKAPLHFEEPMLRDWFAARFGASSALVLAQRR